MNKLVDKNRRNLLLSLPAFALLSGCKSEYDSSAMLGGDSFLSPDEVKFLSALADTIIPATQTPGALAAKVPQTLQNLLTHWASKETRRQWRTNLRLLRNSLDKKGLFINLSSQDRLTQLTLLDKEVYAAQTHPLSGYRDIKATIGEAYYMSELGATQELDYLPIPGDWKGSIPVKKTWAT